MYSGVEFLLLFFDDMAKQILSENVSRLHFQYMSNEIHLLSSLLVVCQKFLFFKNQILNRIINTLIRKCRLFYGDKQN